VPPIPAGTRAPLLILLHASGESPFVMANEAGAGALAARAGAIVALPPAKARRWDVLVPTGDPINASVDMAYVTGLIDRLAADMPVDRGRVFVAGFSIGAVMSERIACQFADRVAAVALNAGAPWSDECRPSRPLPILVMHGTADSTFRIELAERVVDRWRVADGCTGSPTTTQLSAIATAQVNGQCADGVRVEFVRYEGAGHRWFTNPDATDVLWSFFAATAAR
jgi:polyhydroxybutyrate depolymerase